MLPLKPYLSVVDYPSCHTVLPLVVRDAEAVDYENRSANSLELVTLQVIMAHFPEIKKGNSLTRWDNDKFIVPRSI